MAGLVWFGRCIDGWMDAGFLCINGWMDGWMDELGNGLMNA